jgi:hypothetical protein
MTVNHNAAPKQLASAWSQSEGIRVARAGAFVDSRGYVHVPLAEGKIQVTRSLGDCGLHANDTISSKPHVFVHRLSCSDMFLVTASDGVWECYATETAVELAFQTVIGHVMKQAKAYFVAHAKHLGREQVAQAAAALSAAEAPVEDLSQHAALLGRKSLLDALRLASQQATAAVTLEAVRAQQEAMRAGTRRRVDDTSATVTCLPAFWQCVWDSLLLALADRYAAKRKAKQASSSEPAVAEASS